MKRKLLIFAVAGALVLAAGFLVYGYFNKKSHLSPSQQKILDDSGIDYDWVIKAPPDYKDPIYLSGEHADTPDQSAYVLKYQIPNYTAEAAVADYIRYFHTLTGWELTDSVPPDFSTLDLWNRAQQSRLHIILAQERDGALIVALQYFKTK